MEQEKTKDIYKSLIINDGMSATYYEQNRSRKVILYNVHRENKDVVFNLQDKYGWRIPKNFIAEYAINSKTVVLDRPVYKDTVLCSDTFIAVDPMKDKRDKLREFFLNNVLFDDEPFALDYEQLNAILSDENTLVTARAGAGKTRVLIGKMIDLFENQGLGEEELLSFCFNRDAGFEIKDRIKNRCIINGKQKYEYWDIAKTFHAYARSVCATSGKILTERTNLIKLIINELRANDKDFKSKIYEFFRGETLRIDRKTFVDTRAYYQYLRNCEYVTLNNEKVKSKNEKYIADYLFEHDIKYVYERSFSPSKISLNNSDFSADERNRCLKFIADRKEVIPDFYLPEYNAIWEHWAVGGNESNEEIQTIEEVIGSYEEYLKNMDWKRRFWRKNWREKLADENKYVLDIKSIETLIETNSKQFYFSTREDIDKEIERVLITYGINKPKLPDEILLEKAWAKCQDSFTVLIEQFINRLQQTFFDDADAFINEMTRISDRRKKAFCELGYAVYKRYIQILDKSDNAGEYTQYNEYSLDFNQLIYNCAQLILNGACDDSIGKLQWILIDEYQDFTKLFHYLIEAILSRNKDIKLFCVGDDWQAINRFAGSDVIYYKTFRARQLNAQMLNIRANYRSAYSIVDFANAFAHKCGFEGARLKSINVHKGICEEINVSHTYIGRLIDEENIYLKYFQPRESKLIGKAQYLKHCCDIIKNNADRKILILNRSNMLLGMELTRFYDILRNTCIEFMPPENFDKNISVKTVHKAKGEEADVVIVLNVNMRIFPIYNSNNELFEIFGEKPYNCIEDEQKLYYVALTRAKESLYILYNEDNRSPYIMTRKKQYNMV